MSKYTPWPADYAMGPVLIRAGIDWDDSDFGNSIGSAPSLDAAEALGRAADLEGWWNAVDIRSGETRGGKTDRAVKRDAHDTAVRSLKDRQLQELRALEERKP